MATALAFVTLASSLVLNLSLDRDASAHPLDLALLNLSGDPATIHVALEVNPAIGARLLGIDASTMEAAAEPRKADLVRELLESGRLSMNGIPCEWKPPAQVTLVNPQNLRVSADSTCVAKAGSLELDLPFLARQDPSYRMIYVSKLGSSESVGDADPKRPFVRLEVAEGALSLWRFMRLGMAHIGMDPGEWRSATGFHLPYGIDHILFVIALVVGGGGALSLLRTVTGFTIGHSLSLAAATFGLVQFSGRWIEAAIALTIAYVAAVSLLKGEASHRWRIAVGIGFVHGLGFAAALAGLHLAALGLAKAVVGFNLGVELGQAAVVALVLPVVICAGRWAIGRQYLLRGISAGIFVAASYWFMVRAWGAIG